MQDDNYQQPDSNFTLYLALLCVLLPVTSIAVALRIWVRTRFTKTFGVDDTLLIICHIVNTAASIIWLVIQDQQRFYEPRTLALFQALSKLYLISFFMYIISGALVKLVIAAFFIKIARKTWQRILIIGPLGAYLITLTVALFIINLRCGIPVDPVKVLTNETCPIPSAGIIKLGVAIASVNCACDWIFAVVPLQMLCAAKGLSRTSRISAGFVIALALASSAVSVIRLPYFNMLSFTPKFFETIGVTYILSLIETTVAVMAVSLATLKPLLKVLRIGSSYRTSYIEELQDPPPRSPSEAADPNYKPPPRRIVRKKKLRIDRSAMRGVGILPTITLNTEDDEEDDVDGELGHVTVVQMQMPKTFVSARTIAMTMSGVPSINQVLSENNVTWQPTIQEGVEEK